MKTACILLLAACLATACNENDVAELPETFDVISFESNENLSDFATGGRVQMKKLSMNLMGLGVCIFPNVFCAKEYVSVSEEEDFDGPLFATTDGKVRFNSYYSWQYDTWGGIALAQSADRENAASSLSQQFSVWADGGAEGSATYAVLYDSNSPSEEYPDYMTRSGYPTIELISPREIDHIYIANSTMVYNYFKESVSSNFQVKITGWLNGTEKGSVTEVLISDDSKLNDWRKVDLSSFGTVDKLVFKVICNYATDPTYFCIDHIALKRTADKH